MGELRSVADYAHLVRQESWQQAWDADTRTVGEVHEVHGSVYSDAIDQCLCENGSVYVPQMDLPVYLSLIHI